jgi:hypothetical protein
MGSMDNEHSALPVAFGATGPVLQRASPNEHSGLDSLISYIPQGFPAIFDFVAVATFLVLARFAWRPGVFGAVGRFPDGLGH